jgi:hypothetical protein
MHYFLAFFKCDLRVYCVCPKVTNTKCFTFNKYSHNLYERPTMNPCNDHFASFLRNVLHSSVLHRGLIECNCFCACNQHAFVVLLLSCINWLTHSLCPCFQIYHACLHILFSTYCNFWTLDISSCTFFV